jgi:diamine N-acetyltransferase
MTPDLTLRLAEIEDLDFVMAAERDPEAVSVITPRTFEQHVAAIEGGEEEVLIVVDAEGDAVGYALLSGLTSRHRNIEIKTIVITRRGEGVGKRALRLLLALAFDELDAHRVWLDAVSSNERAQHVYLTLGFVREGSMREAWRTGEDAYEDIVLLSMLDREWDELR